MVYKQNYVEIILHRFIFQRNTFLTFRIILQNYFPSPNTMSSKVKNATTLEFELPARIISEKVILSTFHLETASSYSTNFNFFRNIL